MTPRRISTIAGPQARIIAAGLLVMGVCGCERIIGPGFSDDARPTARPPTDRTEALQRVNSNLQRIDRPVQYKAFLSFKFRDADGKTRQFVGNDASLVYSPPRGLIVDVRSPIGVVAQFGSNDERYWVWVEPELETLWWGSWRNAGRVDTRRLPVQPQDLFDALLLRPLPLALDGNLQPLLRVDAEQQDFRLLFYRLASNRQPAGLREIRLDPQPPYMPLEIIDRNADGAVLMHAMLSNYADVEGGGPPAPRKYVVFWPQNGAEMRMDVTRALFRPDIPDDVFAFPADWSGAVEAMDPPTVRPTAPSDPRSRVRE